MTVIDLLTRVDAICKKFDKYDVEKQKDSSISGDDAFVCPYSAVEFDIKEARQKAETASKESNRASAVAINAEIRRTKARLLEEVSKLQRLAVKKRGTIIDRLTVETLRDWSHLMELLSILERRASVIAINLHCHKL